MNKITDSIRIIQEKVIQTAERCGRSPQSVKIVAVSKTQPAQAVREAYQAGLRVFGENRVQEAESKIAEIQDLQAEWHLIGHLQTNKVKKILPLFQLVHSVDSVKLIEAIEKECAKQNKTMPILLQLNLSGEESKFGAEAGELEKLLTALENAPHLKSRGLMTIPPFTDDPEDVRPYFRQLRKVGEQYKNDIIKSGKTLELSMGMTNDFPVAIEEGATLVRIGTAIFGSRFYA
ncbi:MAG: YggS family pyridoxal phosphate-dependent enzyme [Candidatus Omnitrophica bacterium]|nr:YggS family pyridoxal phosphate-dependent enzyme [Candidatus Omnitrophota bacterium]